MHDENSEQKQVTEREISRRTFFSYVNVAIGGFITALLGVPLIGAAILPALKKTKAQEVSAGPITDFQIEQPKDVTLNVTTKDGWIQSQQPRGAWVVEHSQQDFTVFNGRCTHLGCSYNWFPDRKEFICPCHGSHFTITGKVVAGPAPRPLDTLESKIQQGDLIVDFEDFQVGIPQKVAI